MAGIQIPGAAKLLSELSHLLLRGIQLQDNPEKQHLLRPAGLPPWLPPWLTRHLGEGGVGGGGGEGADQRRRNSRAGQFCEYS